MRLGGSVMNPYNSPDEWLAQVRELGYDAVIFPVDCSASASERREYKQCAEDNGLMIGEVGIWRNCMSPDKHEREENIKYAIRQLELAEEVSACCCVNVAGSWGALWDGYHPEQGSQEFYDKLVETTQRIIDAVKPRSTCFSIEPMPWMAPESPEQYLRLIDDVDRIAFGVHLDYTNMINSIDRYRNSSEFIRKCFSMLAPYIRSIHAKDVILDDTRLPLCIEETPPGSGSIDFTEVLTLANGLNGDIPVFVEHLPDHAAYMAASQFMREAARKAKIKRYCK